MWSAEELIVAPATVPGRGARAIVRLAGAGLADLLPRLFTPADPGWPGPAARPRAVRAVLAHDGLGREWGGLDVEILCWPGPGGPIGGPLAEVQLPASGPLVDAVIAEACRHGARLARGGEFTLRAFLSGRLDLVQAEAVLGVVDARSPEQLAAALDRFGGGAGRALAAARNDLLDLLADLEASIDFADESAPDGVPVATDWSHVAVRLEGCRRSVAAVMARHADRDGAAADVPRVALVGRPNIGKSSLFNALVGRAAALVADEAGTTRDWVEARIFGVRGRDWLLVDLAGQDDATAIPDDPLAAVAMARCRAEAERADIVVACRDAGDRRPTTDVSGSRPRIEVLTRCDRLPAWPAHADPLATSAATGAGVAAARDAIDAAVAILPAATSATVRMRAAAGVAIAAIAEAGRLVTASVDRHPGAEAADEAVVAGSIRAAVEALAEATGIGIDGELLDRIFSRHCIGK